MNTVRIALMGVCLLAVSPAAQDFSFIYPDLTYVPVTFSGMKPAPDSIIYRYSMTDDFRAAAGRWLKNIKDDPDNTMPGKDTLSMDHVLRQLVDDPKTRYFFRDIDGDGIDEYIDNGFDASWSHRVRIHKIADDGAYTFYAETPGYLQGVFPRKGEAPVLITSQGFCCGDPVGWLRVNVPVPAGQLTYVTERIFTSNVNMIYPDRISEPVGRKVVAEAPVFILPDNEAGAPILILAPGTEVTVVGMRRTGHGWAFCTIRNQAGLVRLPGGENTGPDETWLGWVQEAFLQ